MFRNPIFGDFSGWGGGSRPPVPLWNPPMSCLLFMKNQFLKNSPHSLITIAIVNMSEQRIEQIYLKVINIAQNKT